MDIETILKDNDIAYERNISLKKKTWIKTGGIVSYWIEPDTLDKAIIIAKTLDDAAIVYDVVGYTSNIYYVDNCNVEVVISTRKLVRYSFHPDFVDVECGVSVSKLSRDCLERGFRGWSGLVGLPGTVGAAACNNSSCFDCSISSLILEAQFYNSATHRIETMIYSDFKYSRRYSILKNTKKGILLSMKLRLVKGDIEEEREHAQNSMNYRKLNHEPPAYTLGSVFSERRFRKDLYFYVFFIGQAFMRVLKIETRDNIKKWRLYLYGYRDLMPYVSKMNVNTFIWKKDCKYKESVFRRYVEFMNKVYDKPKIEIEIRK